jgi:hypothetical protein
MNKNIKKCWDQAATASAAYPSGQNSSWETQVNFLEKFAELIIEAVLDQVKERAYYTGDRDWSDEVDRPWIQLEFGYGSLADAQKGIFK